MELSIRVRFPTVAPMKTLKFKPHLAEEILSGAKTSTWRLFDDKDLQDGGELELMNSDSREVFAKARIDSAVTKKLGELIEEDWEGHEKFASEGEMYHTYNSYYEQEVTPKTEVKIVKFSLLE